MTPSGSPAPEARSTTPAAAERSAGRWLSSDCERGLVSVVIPTYNRESLLLQALESVREQTYRPLEILVVDDGSTDATAQLLSEWCDQYAQSPGLLSRILRQDRAGACAARNRGLQASRGEFIQFLDSDDLLHPDRLRRVVDAFRTTSCDYVITGFEGFCGRCGQVIETRLASGGSGIPLYQLARGEIWGNTAQFTIRRSIAASVGPWTRGLSVFQDFDYLVRLLQASDDLAALPPVLVSVRRGGVPRISDLRVARTGYECMLVGATALSRSLASKGAPLDVRRAYARVLVRIALRLSPREQDLATRFAALACALDAHPTAVRDRLEVFAYRSGPIGRRAHAFLLPIAKRIKSAQRGSGHGRHLHSCPGAVSATHSSHAARVLADSTPAGGAPATMPRVR